MRHEFQDIMAKLEQVETKAEKLAAQQARLTEDLRRREELLADRLQQAREQMRDDFVSLLRSAGADDDQVTAALDAFDEEPPEQVKH